MNLTRIRATLDDACDTLDNAERSILSASVHFVFPEDLERYEAAEIELRKALDALEES